MEAFAEAPVTRLDLQLCRVLKSLGINIQVCRIDLVSLAKMLSKLTFRDFENFLGKILASIYHSK